MSSQLILVAISNDSISEYRIREVVEALKAKREAVFILSSPSRQSFTRFIKLTEGLLIYNQDEYISPTQLFTTAWGFDAIWIFSLDGREVLGQAQRPEPTWHYDYYDLSNRGLGSRALAAA